MKFEEIVEFCRTDDVKSSKEFASLMLSQYSLQALAKNGYMSPSPVQVQAIPIGLLGFDVVVQAKSGTGKTLVFSLLALEGLNAQANHSQVLILAPTREIALQISSVITRLAPRVVRIGAFVGGDKSIKEDIALLKKGVHIVVGTSGRLCHLVSIKALKVDHIRLFVLDEADKLMDENFKNDINYLFSFLPAEKQVAVFSATYPHNIDSILSRYMRSPRLVRAGNDVQLIGIKQYVIVDYYKSAPVTLIALLASVTFSQCIVYANDQIKCQKIYEELLKEKFDVALISSAVNQSERNNVIKLLKNFNVKVLVSTDLTARGIDAENVNIIINMGVPTDCETYLHRIGRAGRFGGYGAAFTILASRKEVRKFSAFVKEGSLRVRFLDSRDSFPPTLCQDEAFYNSCAEFIVDKSCESSCTNERRSNTFKRKADEKEKQTNDDIYGEQSKLTAFSDAEFSDNARLFDSLDNTINTSRNILRQFLVSEEERRSNCSKPHVCSNLELKETKRYSREEMMNIRNNYSLADWTGYALNCFDSHFFNAPFVSEALLKCRKLNDPHTLDTSEASNDCKACDSSAKRKLGNFKFRRSTAKRNVYSKERLMRICQSRSKKEWYNSATTLFNMSMEPFVVPCTSDINSDDVRNKQSEELALNNAKNLEPRNGCEVDVLSKKGKTAKYKFQRTTISRNVYTKSGLMSIRNSKTAEQWKKLASILFDVSKEPFIISSSSNIKSEVIDRSDVLSTEISKQKHTQKLQCNITSDGVIRYSRNALLAIRDGRITAEWELWAKARFNVNDEPFQLDQELRVSVAMQLRVLREREKAMRKSIRNPPQDKDDKKMLNNVIASSRFPRIIDPVPSNFDEYKSRIMDDFNNDLHESDMQRPIGPVVPLRHSPESFKNIVTFCTNCIDRSRVDFSRLIFGDSCSLSDSISNRKADLREFSSIGVQVDLLPNSKDVAVSAKHCSDFAVRDEAGSSSLEQSSKTDSEYEASFLDSSVVPDTNAFNFSSKNMNNCELLHNRIIKKDYYKPFHYNTLRSSLFNEYLRTINGCLRIYQNGI